MGEAIKIDIWSDIACPWCYIGKRNLEAGIARFADRPEASPVEIEYHSFELAPDTPVDFHGSEADFLVQFKQMPKAQVTQMLDHVAGIARTVGLQYDFDAVQHTNTVKAHQMLQYAKAHGLQSEAMERLMRAYFVEGRHVGRDEELADLASEIGLDRDDVLQSLRDDAYLPAVQADQRVALEYGIRGVPFFIIAGRYGISGAQPAETFAAGLMQAVTDRSTAARS